MSIILINLLLGPPLFRLALVRVGEIKNIPGSAASGALRLPCSLTLPTALMAL